VTIVMPRTSPTIVIGACVRVGKKWAWSLVYLEL
jgi:hypothetical protein